MNLNPRPLAFATSLFTAGARPKGPNDIEQITSLSPPLLYST